MKTNRKIIGLLILISILFNLFPRITLAQSDIPITFSELVNYSNSNLNFTNSYNQRNKSEYTNIYNASYTFTNEVGLIGTDISFVDDIGDDYSVIVIPNFRNHQGVLKVSRDGSFSDFPFNTVSRISGTIEFWFASESTGTDTSEFVVMEGANRLMIVQYINGSNIIRINHGATSTDTIVPTWAHISLTFNCITDTYSAFVQGIEVFSDEPFFSSNTAITIDKVRVNQGNGVTGYYDAIGYDWLENIFESSQVGFTFQEFTIGTEFDNSLFPLYENITYLKSGVGVIANIENTDSIDGKYISLIDPNNKNVGIINNFTAIYRTSIDFYSRISNANKYCSIQVSDIDNIALQLVIHNDKLNFYNGSLIPIYDIFVDIWYNISFTIDFSTMKISIYVDSNLIGHYFDVNPSNLFIINFGLITDTLETGVVWDIDSIKYYDVIRSKGIYIIDLNLIPYLEIFDFIYEVDKYQFDYKSDDFTQLRDIDSLDISNWSIIDDSGTLVNIYHGYPLDSNRRVRIVSPGLEQDEFIGIQKVFNKQANIINLSWNINFEDWDVGPKNTSFLLYNIDGFLITDIEFKNPNVRSNENILFSGLGENIEYICNLYINFNDNISIFRFGTNTTFIGYVSIPILNSTSHTLGKVRLATSVQPPSLFIIYLLDDLGVYIDGSSLSTEFGYFEFFTGLTYFSFLHPLFTFNGIGNVSFTVLDDTSHLLLRNVKSYTGITTFNTNERNYFFYTSVSFRLYFNSSLQYTSFKNTGVRAIQSEATLIPTFSNSGVDTETNFFYVDINNRLAFIHEADDTNVEFIQISFILFQSFSTNDRTIIFQSNKNNIAKGFFQVGFNDDTSNVLQLPSFFSTTSAVLTQEKIVNQIIITITDDNIDSLVGITTGYVSNIVFGFGINFNITVATLSLLLMLVPLLIILLPTMLIGLRLGKQAIMPLFLLMSLLCAITEIIPIWLFFIIAISSSVFILRKKEFV